MMVKADQALCGGTVVDDTVIGCYGVSRQTCEQQQLDVYLIEHATAESACCVLRDAGSACACVLIDTCLTAYLPPRLPACLSACLPVCPVNTNRLPAPRQPQW